MKNLLKCVLLIFAALIAGGIIGWVGGLIGYTTPTIVAVIIAICATYPHINGRKEQTCSSQIS